MRWPSGYQWKAPWDMGAKSGRTLVLALRGSLLCCLYMEGVHLEDWRASRKGARSADNAVSILRIWLETYQPDCIIIENTDMAQRKGDKKRGILSTLARVAEDHEALNIEVIRQQEYVNMYEEAEALAVRYPQLRPWLPKQPPIWMPEPRNTVYFEALAMALQVLDG